LKTHLETSPDDTVAVQLLNGTTDACSHARLLLSDFCQPTSDTDGSDDDVSDDGHDTNGTDRVAEKIKMYTQCLLDLSAAIECPAPDAEHVDPVVTQPQRDSLPSAAKTGSIPPLSDHLVELWAPSALEIDARLPPLLDEYSKAPTNFNAMPEVDSHTGNEPLEVSTSMSVPRPIGITTHATQLVRKTLRDENGRRFYECPFRKAEARLGLLYTCTEVVMDTVSAVRIHLTRNLPGGRPPHLPFLKLCPTCNEDILDDTEFVTRHAKEGLKCENPRPHGRGAVGQQQQYDRLCHRIEIYIAAQEAQKGIWNSESKPSR